MPDFFDTRYQSGGKIYQIITTVPNDHEVYQMRHKMLQMTIEYTNIFPFQGPPKLTQIGIYTIRQPCRKGEMKALAQKYFDILVTVGEITLFVDLIFRSQSLTRLSWQVCKDSLKREGISTHVLHQEIKVGLETSGGKGAYLKCMHVHGEPIKVPLDLA
jgi:hypothetical protein